MDVDNNDQNDTGGTSFISEDAAGSGPAPALITSETTQNTEISNQVQSSEDGFAEPATTSDFAFQVPALLSVPPKKSKNKESDQSQPSETKHSLSPVGDEKQQKCDTKSTPSSSASASKTQTSLPYTEPSWGMKPDDESYSFDVLKNGKIIGTIFLNDKSFYVFGRLPSCDVTLEHPTLSRYHAVMQFSGGGDKEKGWYIYDLDSTHGTWVNKRKIPPKSYLKVKVGYVVKFGGSTRLHIMQGPQEDQEEESELSFTEMKYQRERLKKEAELVKQMDMQAAAALRQSAEQQVLQDRGCSWGMGEDAVEEEEDSTNLTSLVAENEELYIDDPKKALKGFYEREGCDLPDYQFSEAGFGKHKCIVHLPVDGPNGEELVAEATVSGKRKDAVVACALEACRILDKLGMLRASTHESRKRKQKKWEDNDFYDSDEDTFLDRTGTIEKKRALRMQKAGKDETETYDSLMEKYTKVKEALKEVEDKLAKAKAEAEQMRRDEDQDELEAYMNSIKSGAMDPKTRIRLKAELMKLKAEEVRLRKLVNIAQPASLPPLKPSQAPVKSPSVDSLARKVHQKVVKKPPTIPQPQTFEEKPEDFEEEDDEGEDVSTSSQPENVQSTSVRQAEAASRLSGQLQGGQKVKTGDGGDGQLRAKRRDDGKIKVKGPFMPPSMLAELAKGKTSAEAFESVQKVLSSESTEVGDNTTETDDNR